MLRLPLPLEYRGWSVSKDIYCGYSGIGPDYDADWLGEETGWQDNGQKVWGATLPDLYYEIDIWFEENAK